MNKKKFRKIEFILAIIIATLLVLSLLSQQFLNLPYQLISILILAFIVVKLTDIIKGGGTIFEDYVSLAIIIIFGIIQFFLGERINSLIITVIIFLLIYSIGMMPWVNTIIKSKEITSFILSYAFFVIITILLFAGAYFANNTQFTYLGKSTHLSFEDALYFSTISFTTVGYGEISPVGINKLISSIQAITGMILNIAFIGYILASQRFKKKSRVS